MSDCIKCGLISLGIGMAAGIHIATNNKKLQNFVKDTEAMIEEKLDMAKQGVSDLKEKYMPEEVSEGENFDKEMIENNKKSSYKVNKKGK